MNLRELQDAAATEKIDAMSVDLRKHATAAIAESMGLVAKDERHAVFTKYIAIYFWLGCTVLTFVTAYGGAVGWWAVDERAFAPLWSTFAVGFFGVIAKLVGAEWRRRN
jgi:hypothetical protein